MIRLSLALALGALSLPVQAQEPLTSQAGDSTSAAAQLAAQRQALVQQRSQAQERFSGEQADCRSRFLASSCLRDAEARHRTELAPLRQQEIALDRAERERKTVVQQERAAQKKAAHEASRQAVPLTTPTPAAEGLVKASPHSDQQAEQARQRQAQREAKQATKTAEAQSRQEEAEQRARKTQERQARAERYRQEQQSMPAKPVPLPLPLPAAPQ